jgi:hypothetical protein
MQQNGMGPLLWWGGEGTPQEEVDMADAIAGAVAEA